MTKTPHPSSGQKLSFSSPNSWKRFTLNIPFMTPVIANKALYWTNSIFSVKKTLLGWLLSRLFQRAKIKRHFPLKRPVLNFILVTINFLQRFGKILNNGGRNLASLEVNLQICGNSEQISQKWQKIFLVNF